jgi:hypothetical protein
MTTPPPAMTSRVIRARTVSSTFAVADDNAVSSCTLMTASAGIVTVSSRRTGAGGADGSLTGVRLGKASAVGVATPASRLGQLLSLAAGTVSREGQVSAPVEDERADAGAFSGTGEERCAAGAGARGAEAVSALAVSTVGLAAAGGRVVLAGGVTVVVLATGATTGGSTCGAGLTARGVDGDSCTTAVSAAGATSTGAISATVPSTGSTVSTCEVGCAAGGDAGGAV